MIVKIISKAGYDMFLEKIYQWQQTKAGTEILMELSEKSLEIGTVFKEAGRDLIIIFLFHEAAWKFKSHLHMYRK